MTAPLQLVGRSWAVVLLLALGVVPHAVADDSPLAPPVSAVSGQGSATATADPATQPEQALEVTARWAWRPMLFALTAFEHDAGLLAPLTDRRDRGSSWQPALACAVDVERIGPRTGFQSTVFALGRGPVTHRQLVLDARVHAFEQLGERWRLDLDARGRLERRQAAALVDFQRHEVALALERGGTHGPAWRLHVTEGQRDVPRLAGLDVSRSGLALGPVFALARGVSVAPSALLQHESSATARGWRAGFTLEASRVRTLRSWALRYSWSAALYEVLPAAAFSSPGTDLGPTATRVGADFLVNAANASQPTLVADLGAEPPAVPLVDTLDDDDGLPARHVHALALYASERIGPRLRLAVGARFTWRREASTRGLEPHAPLAERFSLRATLRLRLASHAALLGQVAHAAAQERLYGPGVERTLAYLGLQLH